MIDYSLIFLGKYAPATPQFLYLHCSEFETLVYLHLSLTSSPFPCVGVWVSQKFMKTSQVDCTFTELKEILSNII